MNEYVQQNRGGVFERKKKAIPMSGSSVRRDGVIRNGPSSSVLVVIALDEVLHADLGVVMKGGR